MSNRAQRRAAQKKQPAMLRGTTKEQRIAMLCKNGITPEMLDKAQQDGYRDGADNAARETIKIVYAAVMLAANEEFRFGRERVMRLIDKVDLIVTTSLGSREEIEAVWDRFKLTMQFKEGVNRIAEQENDG